MKKIILFLMVLAVSNLIISLSGCQKRSIIDEKLDAIDAIIETDPETALSWINDIDENDLTLERDKARYALLKSMALDKNYIDMTTFDVLQPAIDYYSEHGTANDKLRMNFYKGKVYLYADSQLQAMKAFVEALEFREKTTDTLVLARLLLAHSNICLDLYDVERSIEDNKETLSIYKMTGKIEAYQRALMRIADYYFTLSDTINGLKYLKLAEEEFDDMPMENKAQFADLKFYYASAFGDSLELIRTEEEMKDFLPVDNYYLNWLMKSGRKKEALNEYRNMPMPQSDVAALGFI